jgi:serine/threonine protein phosphatase PrpC
VRVGGRETQEDCVVAERLKETTVHGWLLAVLDGHGGDKASAGCAAHLPVSFAQAWSESNGSTEAAVRQVFAELDSLSRRDSGGTTLSLAVVDEKGGRVTVGFVGDSPVVVRSVDGVLCFPQRHHASDEVQRQHAIERGAAFRSGYLFNRREDGALDRDGGAIILSRALGASNFAFVDPTPQIERLDLGPESSS